MGRVVVRNHSLFAPEDVEGRRFGWALGAANWVHVRTRAGLIRSELLLEEGDCFDAHALAESERMIRDLDFIARVETRAERTEDGAWGIHVETWDEWTTQVGLDFDVESRFQFMGFFVREKNLLGRGLRLTFRYRDFRERNDRLFTLATGRFLGTRANAAIGAGTTRTGAFFNHEISYPYVSEAGRFFLESRLRYEDREYAYLTGDHASVSHVLFPLTDVDGRLRAARRWGRPGALRILGGEVLVIRRTVSDAPRMVVRGDFGGAVPAHDSLAARLAPQAEPDSWLRVGVTGGIRRLRFTTAQGLDRVTGVQNVALGSEVLLTVGRTLGTWGTDPLSTYAALDAYLGAAAGSLTATATFEAEARRLDRSPGEGSRWRDIFATGQAQAYLQPGGSPLHTFVAGVRGQLRRNQDQPFQMALGGDAGVRSYRDDEVPTGSALVGYLEHRFNPAWLRPTLDLGFLAFADVGRGWASNVPFGQDTGWRRAAGVGLRMGAPAGTGSITRIELAWPVGGPDRGRSPVLRTYWSLSPTSR